MAFTSCLAYNVRVNYIEILILNSFGFPERIRAKLYLKIRNKQFECISFTHSLLSPFRKVMVMAMVITFTTTTSLPTTNFGAICTLGKIQQCS